MQVGLEVNSRIDSFRPPSDENGKTVPHGREGAWHIDSDSDVDTIHSNPILWTGVGMDDPVDADSSTVRLQNRPSAQR